MKKIVFIFSLLTFLCSNVISQITFSKRLSYYDSVFGSLDGDPFSIVITDSGYIFTCYVISDSVNNGWSSYSIFQTDFDGNIIKKNFFGIENKGLYGGIADNTVRKSNKHLVTIFSVLNNPTNVYDVDAGLFIYDYKTDTFTSKAIDLGGNEVGRTLVKSTDKGYVIVGTQSAFGVPDVEVGKILLVKTDSVGNYQWHRAYNSPTRAFGLGICLAHDGGYVLSAAGLKPGRDTDTYIIKTDTAGNVEWTKNYGTINFDGGGGLYSKQKIVVIY